MLVAIGISLLLAFCQWIQLRKKSEKAMATHSSTLAWKIPWTEEPGRLQSMGSKRSAGGGIGYPLQYSWASLVFSW